MPIFPTYVADGAGVGGGGGITPPLPAGLAVNDMLLLYMESANEVMSVINHNGGAWALVDHSGQGTAGVTTSTGVTVYWSRYNGTQGSPTSSNPDDHVSGYIAAFRGVKVVGNPWNAKAISSEVTEDTSLSADGVTTTVDDCLIVTAAVLMDDNPDFGTWVNANLSSLTERLNYPTSVGNDGRLMTVTGGKATANPTGATTNTLTVASRKAMVTIALEPAGAGDAETVTNPLGLTDTGTAELFHEFDPLGLTDSIVVLLTANLTLTDPLGLTDSIVVEQVFSAHTRTPTDALGLSDSVVVSQTGTNAHSQAINNALGLTDSITVELIAPTAWAASHLDVLGLDDSIIVELNGVIQGLPPLVIRHRLRSVFYRSPVPVRLILVPTGNAQTTGFSSTAEGWEEASAPFLMTQGTHEQVMALVVSAWAAHANAPIATLLNAVNQELQNAGYRGSGGADLT